MLKTVFEKNVDTNDITHKTSDALTLLCVTHAQRSSYFLKLTDNSADRWSANRILVPAKTVQTNEILYFNILYRFWSEPTRTYLKKNDFPIVSLNTVKLANIFTSVIYGQRLTN